MKRILAVLFVALAVFSLTAGGQGEKKSSQEVSVLVFIPGIRAGSPTYDLMAQGAEAFTAAHQGVSLKVFEADFNQAQWEEQLMSLVSRGGYNVVVTSNPSLTDICADAAERFKNVTFIVTDAYASELPENMVTVMFNQYEQCLMLGYLAGLLSETDGTGKIGYIAAQEFPMLNNHMVAGFRDGAHMVKPGLKLDFRVIGNWYDAAKCAQLAKSMIESGAGVFTSTCGGAETGLLKIAEQYGAKVLEQSISAYELSPAIVGCGTIAQKELVEKLLNEYAEGRLVSGKSEVVGIGNGFVGFDFAGQQYKALPEEVKTKFEAFYVKLKEGKADYTLPPL